MLFLASKQLADADEAIRRRPDWPKGHFRRAEALSQAGMHADALVSYERGSALDPSDEHLAGQCVAARTRHADAASAERRHIGIGAMIGLLAVLLIVVSSSDGGTASRVAATFFGGLLGAFGGVGYVLLRRQQRHGAVLPPLQSNEHFCALQMRGDKEGAGELRSKVLEQAGPEGGGVPSGGFFGASPAVATPSAGAATAGGAGGGSEAKRRVRSNANGRAAALAALKGGKKA